MTPQDQNAARAADRVTMAEKLVQVALDAGANSACFIRGGTYSPRSVRVLIDAPGGLGCRIDIDGGSRYDSFVSPWSFMRGTGYENQKIAHHAFGYGTVNPHHQRKATLVAKDFPALIEQVREVVTLCASGDAYE